MATGAEKLLALREGSVNKCNKLVGGKGETGTHPVPPPHGVCSLWAGLGPGQGRFLKAPQELLRCGQG